jgi:hypothetical protein
MTCRFDYKIDILDKEKGELFMKELMSAEEILEYRNRKYNNQPVGTDDIVNACDIIIPEDFQNSHTHLAKIKRVIRRYIMYGMLDKPISVIVETNERGKPNKFILINEYSRYLAAVKWIGLNILPVRYIDIDTYCKEHRK